MSTPLDLPEMPPIDVPPEAPEAPPKRGRGRPRKDPSDTAPRQRTTTRKPSGAALEKRLGASMTSLGIFVSLASPADGMVVLEGVPALAAALSKLAEENPAVKANLERALTAGAWSGVIAAALPILVGILANHGAVPKNIASMLGTPAAADGGA
ncbi:hypothetical protein ACFV4G_39640 [Kitasatospora sp. NPDC059747]|uniref:hypothetical protein n=1 Tax=Kitasatospora sp. NPDC059747 TaxID=3346930 RepID=UPI00365FCE27